MLLVEEYLQRHAIKVPLIKHHSSEAVVFFKDNHGIWCIKRLAWHPPDIHPGNYSVTTLRCNHNGLERGRYFDTVADDEAEIQWDEYEQYLLEWTAVPRIVPCTDQEITVAAWEMLLRCCDKALIRHIHYDTLTKSIDTDLPIAERVAHIQTCLEYFSTVSHDVHHMWNGDLMVYRERYAHWLAEMVVQCKE